MTIQVLTKNFLNLIYPIHCYICEKNLDPIAGSGLCDMCRSKIRYNPKAHSQADKCSNLERSYSSCLYEGPLKELIHQFKYNRKAAIGRILSGFMIEYINENSEILNGIDLITFVPLENSRLRERGFNQSRMLASNISKKFGIAFEDTLKKTEKTLHQSELSREERLVNLNGAFKTKDNTLLGGCRILLIDDVMTTGATLDECAKTLLAAGAKSVRGFTLARGI